MFSFLICLIICPGVLVSGYDVVLSGDSYIIQGGTARFKAEVYKDDGTLNTDEFKFEWYDDADPQHTTTFQGKSPALWNVTYNPKFPPGVYNITVKVLKNIIVIWSTVGSATKALKVREFVTGDLVLSQGNLTRKNYVSNGETVNHTIVLQKSDLDFLNKTTNFLRTFWFVDCIYYGQESGFQFNFNYTKEESVHYVDALLVGTYLPKSLTNLPQITDKNTINTTTVGGNVTVSTPSPIGNSSIGNNTIKQNEVDKGLLDWLDAFNKTQHSSISKQSNYCINSSVVPILSNYTYGFFRTKFTVKSPIKISPINGTNWLMDGEILNINVSCTGSSPYSFCVLLKSGLYNVTGNETCKETMLRNCSFGIQHLFKKPSEYTLVVIISNAVSRVVKPIAVNIYEVKKHAQLSVIIVPVSFTVIAIVIIIFGVAYYLQSKQKYTIEVADFDFGNQTSNMEYKSFRERLRESISNFFFKSHDYEDSDSAWSEGPPTSRKYGSMQ